MDVESKAVTDDLDSVIVALGFGGEGRRIASLPRPF